jgi:hypothetical protein
VVYFPSGVLVYFLSGPPKGDDNRNASVAVSYRKQGSAQWKQGLPLLRLQNERIYANVNIDVIAPNMFAGSVLDLDPDTAYEVQFVMTDPDGVRGEARKTVTVRTRPEPKSLSADAHLTSIRQVFKVRSSSRHSRG